MRVLGILQGALAALPLLCSCNHYREVQLPGFALATAMAPMAEGDPPVLPASTRPETLPEAVPFIVVYGNMFSGSDEFNARKLRGQAREFRPDFLLFSNRGIVSGGAIVQPGGFYAQPIDRHEVAATCFRIAPARLGIRFDENNMVVDIDEPSRACGILEGDTLVSVGAAPLRGDPGDYVLMRLRLQPGENVLIEWIRPGVGKQRGLVRLMPPVPLENVPAVVPASQKP